MSATTKPTTGPGPATKTFDHAMAGLKDGVASATHDTAPHQAESGAETMTAAAKQMLSFHQENLAAVMQSGQILAAGFQDIAKHMASSARTAMDEGMAAFQALPRVTSLKDAMELQTNFVRASYERATGDANRLSETSLRLGEQAAAPLNARMTAAANALLPRH